MSSYLESNSTKLSDKELTNIPIENKCIYMHLFLGGVVFFLTGVPNKMLYIIRDVVMKCLELCLLKTGRKCIIST